jgi:hypothetical protein
MRHEMRQQLLEARLVHTYNRLVILSQAEQAEQVQMQVCGWHPFASLHDLGAGFSAKRQRCPL